MYFTLENKYFLYLLWALLPVLLLFAWWLRWRKKARSKLGDKVLINSLVKRSSGYNYFIKFFLCLLALVMLVIGTANPQKEANSYSIDGKDAIIVFIVDVSLSMLAEDITPNRLARAKQSVLGTILELKQEQVGIVAFAGQSFPLLPLTTDYASFTTHIVSLTPQLVRLQGSSIQEALQTSFQLLMGSPPQNSLVFLLSDGETFNEDFNESIKLIKNFKGRICTIGLGRQSGSSIPLYNSDQEKSYKKDKQGNDVVTRLNEANLRKLASQGHGEYHYSANIEQTALFMKEQIDLVKTASINKGKLWHRVSYAHAFFALALGLLLLELMLPLSKI